MKVTFMEPSLLRYVLDLAQKHYWELGFIPRDRYEMEYAKHRLLIQYENDEPCGFLMHGAIYPQNPLKIYQVVIQTDARRVKSATDMVDVVLARATAFGASAVGLRCAADLESNLFWRACGFVPIALTPGGRTHSRDIITYHLGLPEKTPHRLYQLSYIEDPGRNLLACSVDRPAIAFVLPTSPLVTWDEHRLAVEILRTENEKKAVDYENGK